MGAVVSSNPSYGIYVEEIKKQRIQEHYENLNKSHQELVLSPQSLEYLYKNKQTAQSVPNFSVLVPDDRTGESESSRERSNSINNTNNPKRQKKVAYLEKRVHSVLATSHLKQQCESGTLALVNNHNSSFSSQTTNHTSQALFSRINTERHHYGLSNSKSQNDNLNTLIETDLT